MTQIRVELPYGLRVLAGVGTEVLVSVAAPVSPRSLLDALEEALPALRGTIRDQATKRRRPFLRFFACEEDLSHCPPDQPLPPPVVEGREAFLIVGAIAGG